MQNLFLDFKKELIIAGKVLKLDNKTLKRISTPEKIISKTINFKGKKIKAYRVQFNSTLGP